MSLLRPGVIKQHKPNLKDSLLVYVVPDIEAPCSVIAVAQYTLGPPCFSGRRLERFDVATDKEHQQDGSNLKKLELEQMKFIHFNYFNS